MNTPLDSADPVVPHPLGLFTKLSLVARDIKLSHSLFALPFAILAAFIARSFDAESTPPIFIAQIALIVACMVFARTWAMLINRIADRRFDAQNPRTNKRALASGNLDPRSAWFIAGSCALIFIALCAGFYVLNANFWPIALSIPTLVWIALYSYTKRFTAFCHLFLGGALAFSPIASVLAIYPHTLALAPAIWLIAGMVLFWVAGFDVIYALQDLSFDRSRGLYSIPARLGAERAIWISRVLHMGAFIMLFWAGQTLSTADRMGMPFSVAIFLVGLLLIAEHVVLARRGQVGLNMAFFTINGIVSCLLGTVGVIDLLTHR